MAASRTTEGSVMKAKSRISASLLGLFIAVGALFTAPTTASAASGDPGFV